MLFGTGSRFSLIQSMMQNFKYVVSSTPHSESHHPRLYGIFGIPEYLESRSVSSPLFLQHIHETISNHTTLHLNEKSRGDLSTPPNALLKLTYITSQLRWMLIKLHLPSRLVFGIIATLNTCSHNLH